MTARESALSRRTFVKGSLAGLALAGASGSALYGCAPQSQKDGANGAADAPADQIAWSQCNVN